MSGDDAPGSMRERICLITGASAGIGEATARELARRGATAVLVCRSRERGEAARAEIRRTTGNDSVYLLLADLSAQRRIRRLADEFRERYGRLHVLVNNAGLYTRRRSITEDGMETQFAVNHLAPFLLTRLLLDVLKSSAPSRVVTVSSEAHRRGRIDFDDLQGERDYRGLRAYSQSKLANILFTRELDRRLKGSGVTANALHPGVVATKLLFGGWAFMRLLKPLLKRPEEGARTSLHLATAPELEGVSGKYFKREVEIEPAPQARDPQTARRLWEVSAQLTRLRQPTD